MIPKFTAWTWVEGDAITKMENRGGAILHNGIVL